MVWLADLLLSLLSVPDGVLLIDEIENGLHHSVLEHVWKVIDKASDANNTQVIATTHSYECVEAMNSVLASDDFRLHRLEVRDQRNRCVTYGPDAIQGAMKFSMEVR